MPYELNGALEVAIIIELEVAQSVNQKVSRLRTVFQLEYFRKM